MRDTADRKIQTWKEMGNGEIMGWRKANQTEECMKKLYGNV